MNEIEQNRGKTTQIKENLDFEKISSLQSQDVNSKVNLIRS